MATFPLEKRCNKCKITKPLSEFYDNKNGKYGKKSICAICEKARTNAWRAQAGQAHKDQRYYTRLKAVYGLTKDEYIALVIEQNHKCYLCGIDELKALYGRLCVDHCHTTGKIRKLLCHNCNAALGQFKDNVEAIQKAADYLREYNNEHLSSADQ